MTVTDVHKDLDARTLVITAVLQAEPTRAWQLWADPRQLERWWGPPTYPATVVEHDLSPGGLVHYFMTGPEGDRHDGYFRITSADAPERITFTDGFCDEQGSPNDELPTTDVEVRFAADGAATRMTITSTFASREAMEQMVAMGMVEGMSEALSQIEGILSGSGV